MQQIRQIEEQHSVDYNLKGKEKFASAEIRMSETPSDVSHFPSNVSEENSAHLVLEGQR